MPDISRLVIEVDSKGVVTATGNLENFSKASVKAGKSSSGLSGKIRSTGKDADDLSGKLRSSGKDADNLAQNFVAFQLVIDKLPAPLQNVAAGLLGLVNPGVAVVGVFLDIAGAAVKYVQESVDAFAKFETLKTSLEIVMGSAEAASRTFNELSVLAGSSPFNIDQLADTATLLKTSNINTKELIPTLKMLGDVSKGSADVFNRVAFNFAQVGQTGKATSMDLRQFQMAGVPITNMLKDIGKEGDYSFNAISEAIRNATKEGGMFFNAMEKGAETLTSMRSNIAGQEEQLKALLAELKGWGDFSKMLNGYRMRSNAELIKAMQAVTAMSTHGSAVEQYEAIKNLLEVDVSKIKLLDSTILSPFNDALTGIKLIQDTYNTNDGDISGLIGMDLVTLQRMAELEEWRTSELEKQSQLLATQQDKEIEILAAFEKTSEGEKIALEEKIAYWKELREAQFEYFTGEYDTIGGLEVPIYDTKGLSDEFKRMIDVILEGLQNVGEAGKEAVVPFRDWVQVLAQATGYLEKDIGGVFNELTERWEGGWGGLATVEKYAAEGIEAVRDLKNLFQVHFHPCID